MINTRDSATNGPEGGVAGEAALIATFYGRRDLTPRIHEALYRAASGAKEDNDAIPDNWTGPSGEVLLQRFDPPGICARGLAECLAIQLRERDRFDPAMQKLIENLPLLAEYLPYPRESAAGMAFRIPLTSRRVGDSITVMNGNSVPTFTYS